MPKNKDNYECPCCGYDTHKKHNMINHLYNLKNPCPKSKNNIELTEEIKDHIIKNRVYKIESSKPPTKTITQIFNNYQTNYNMIASMDTLGKLTKYMNYRDLKIKGFEETIDDKFTKKAQYLENNKYKGTFSLDQSNFLEIIDEISKLGNNTLENFNVYYDPKLKKLHVHDNGEWTESIIDIGIQKIILSILKDYYFDSYECYLHRLLHGGCESKIHPQDIEKYLIEYYKFIGSNDLDPYIKGMSDNKILYNRDDERFDKDYEAYDYDAFSICDRYYKVFTSTRDNTTKSEINKIKRQVIDVIKTNSTKNMKELNKNITELFVVDEVFKTIVANMYSKVS
jgi:hypothetical protein